MTKGMRSRSDIIDGPTHLRPVHNSPFAALKHWHQHTDVIEVLLRAGINVNHISSTHGTALYYACDEQNKHVVRLLLDYGADPNLSSDSRGNPFTAYISSYVSHHMG